MIFRKTTLALAIGIASSSALAASNIQELETTVVAAETQQNQEVITALQMKENMVNDLDDLVKHIPGVVIKSADTRWGGTGFNIRGVADDRIAVTIDGLAQGESLQYEGGQAYGYFKGGRNGLEVESLKQVTITKGADSVISGSGALGGSVRFVTKDADDYLKPSGDDWGSQVSSSYDGSSDSYMGNFSAAARVGQFEALAILTQRKGHETENHTAGDDIDGSGRERPDEQDREQKSLLLKLNYDISENNTLGVVFENRQVETETDAKSYNGPWYVGRVGDDSSARKRVGIFHKLDVETALFDHVEWSIDRQDIDFEAKTGQSVTFYGGLTPRVDTRSFDQEITHYKVDFTKQFIANDVTHDLFYGLAYADKDVTNEQVRVQTRQGQETTFSVNQALIPTANTKNYNLFALDRITLSDKVQLEIGLRYDDYDYSAKSNESYSDPLDGSLEDQDFDFISGAFGVKYQLNDNYRLEAKVGRAFRAPTVEELYTRSGSADDWRTGPNPDLDVETATNFEVTLHGAFEAGTFSVTPFFNKYQDFIESVDLTRTNGLGAIDDYSISDNVGDADIKGLEISANLNLAKIMSAPEGLGLSFSAAYAEGEQDNGDPLTSIQPFNARISLSYRSTDNSWGIDTTLEHTQAKDANDAYSTLDDGTREERDYLSDTSSVLDLTAFYHVNDQLTLRAGIHNLTDEEYYTWDGIRFVGRDDNRPGIGVNGSGIKRFTEPGRNLSLRADYTF